MSDKKPSKTKEDVKEKKSSSKKEGRADHVIVRNLFSLGILRRVSTLVWVALLCAILSLVSAYQVVQIKTPPQYIQLTEDGRIFPVAPLRVASVSDGEIMEFAAQSVKWINTYDYINWKDQLQSQATRFTPAGWNNYMTSLVNSDNLNSVNAQRMVVSASPTSSVQIRRQGVVEDLNQYVWLVDVPARVTYTPSTDGQTSANSLQQDGVITLYIVRVPLEINLRGYAIQIYQFDTSKTKA